MTKVKKISKSAIALLFAVMFLVTMLPSMFGSMNAEAKNPDGRNRLGCWWWYFEDTGNETTRENYLTLLEQTGVTEIYIEAYTQLWSTGLQPSLHRFVEAAMKHGMRTSVMMDDAALATSEASSYTYIQKLYKGWVSYKQTYPNDWLYGIHFDVEAGNYSTTGLQNYCNYLVKNAQETLINNGVYVEFDVNPAWKGAAGVSYNGVNGFYNVLASVLANGKGCLSLMSYRATSAKVMSRANEGGAVDAAKKYNCDYMYGIETDNVEAGVDIHNKDKAYLCSMLDDIFATIDRAGGSMNAGVAIHHARCYYQLAGTLPTTKIYVPGDSPTTKPSVQTTASTAPTTAKPTAPTTPIIPITTTPTQSAPSKTTPSQPVTTTQSAPSKTVPSQPVTPTQSVPSKITPIIEIFYGDVNDDGEINMKDILALRKFIAGLNGYINKKTSDVIADGVINMKDVLQLRKFVANVVDEDALGPQG